MRSVYALTRRVAPTELPVAVVGATGTGKELVASALHLLSNRRGAAFVDINCSAIPEHLLEGELFGWERGAFTGADRAVAGLLELAHGGTLFLDEACSLPRTTQTKLLRVIEQHRCRRLGGRADRSTDFRLVMAMNKSPQELEADGSYLPAFVYRVCGAAIHLPPLDGRGADIRALATAFLAKTAEESGRSMDWTESGLSQIQSLSWPGNVRELRALVSRLPLFSRGGLITADDVLASMIRRPSSEYSVDDLEAALRRNSGNFSRAAAELGLPRTTFRSRLLKTGLEGSRPA